MSERIVARYIGEDGMGLHTDELYVIKSEIMCDLLWITWGTNSRPYPNLEKFLDDWEVTKHIW